MRGGEKFKKTLSQHSITIDIFTGRLWEKWVVRFTMLWKKQRFLTLTVQLSRIWEKNHLVVNDPVLYGDTIYRKVDFRDDEGVWKDGYIQVLNLADMEWKRFYAQFRKTFIKLCMENFLVTGQETFTTWSALTM